MQMNISLKRAERGADDIKSLKGDSAPVKLKESKELKGLTFHFCISQVQQVKTKCAFPS